MRLQSLLASLVLASTLAAQTVHHVPAEHPTIQDAVDVAASDDIILISKGVYTEAVTVAGKTGLVLRAKGKVVIDPPAGNGLTLTNCTGCRVEKIRVGGGSIGFLLVDCDDCVLTGCRVEGNAGDGIRLEGGSGNTLEKCRVEQAADDGISLGAGSLDAVTRTLVSKCIVDTTGNDGIDVNGTLNVIEKCKVVAPDNGGLLVDDSTASTGNEFRDCKVFDPGTSGAVLTGDGNTLLRCRIKGNQSGFAIHVLTGNDNVVEECKSIKSAVDAIVVGANAVNAVLRDCKVKASGEDGFAIMGLGTEVSGCKATGSLFDGCVVNCSVSEFFGNVMNGNGANGFILTPDSGGNTLTENVAKGNSNFDLLDESENENVFTDNTFKNVSD